MTRFNRFVVAFSGCAVHTAGCARSASAPPQQLAAQASPPGAPAATSATTTSGATRIVAAQHRPQGDIVFEAALDLGQTPGDASPQLRHGIEATTADWPDSLYVTFPTPDGTAACTATLVGPRAMLTAAHCVPQKGNVSFKYKP